MTMAGTDRRRTQRFFFVEYRFSTSSAISGCPRYLPSARRIGAHFSHPIDCSKKTILTVCVEITGLPTTYRLPPTTYHLPPTGYLNRSSNALRAPLGAWGWAFECVSRSTVTRGENSSHAFRASLGEIRAEIVCVHSNRWPASNDSHWAQV